MSVGKLVFPDAASKSATCRRFKIASKLQASYLPKLNILPW